MKLENKRVVVKVGTKVLSGDDGRLDLGTLKSVVRQVVEIKKSRVDVILVTSGAMGAGRGVVKVRPGGDKVAERQVLAAVGQPILMGKYLQAFEEEGARCAQVLATKGDFRDKTHYLNMRACFENLLANGIVPVVNENDAVAVTELLFTDNDELAGLVSSQVGAQTCVIMTSVDGFLSGDPGDPASRLVPVIDVKDAAGLQKFISPNKTAFGRGGMLTKFNIAKKLSLQGVTVHFVNGKTEGVLTDLLLKGEPRGTKFVPQAKSSGLKRRIAYSAGLAKGSVRVNAQAARMLASKTAIMSLLPVGVTGAEGDFGKGDVVQIIGPDGANLGYGVSKYAADKVRETAGAKNGRPVIHYDHMFIEA